MKKALITGITGQDGSYLIELLLEKGYQVHGIIRRSSSFNTGRIDHLYNDSDILNKKMFLHYGDLTDSSNLNRLLEKIHPDEIYQDADNLDRWNHAESEDVVVHWIDLPDDYGQQTIEAMAVQREVYRQASYVPCVPHVSVQL